MGLYFGVGDGASQRLTRSQVHHQTSRHASDAKVEKLAIQLGVLDSQQHYSPYKSMRYAPFSDVHEKPLHAVDLYVDNMGKSTVGHDS